MCGLRVGVGWRCVVKPELLVLLHVCRYFRPKGFRLAGKNEVVDFVDTLQTAKTCASECHHTLPEIRELLRQMGPGLVVSK